METSLRGRSDRCFWSFSFELGFNAGRRVWARRLVEVRSNLISDVALKRSFRGERYRLSCDVSIRKSPWRRQRKSARHVLPGVHGKVLDLERRLGSFELFIIKFSLLLCTSSTRFLCVVGFWVEIRCLRDIGRCDMKTELLRRSPVASYFNHHWSTIATSPSRSHFHLLHAMIAIVSRKIQSESLRKCTNCDRKRTPAVHERL